jgi:alpha-1,6-mannosyltransferase
MPMVHSREPSAHAGTGLVPARGGTHVRETARAAAAISVVDVTEYWAEESGGIRTYLHAKERFAAERGPLRQVLVVPGARSQVVDRPGARRYEVRGPRIPFQPPYRFLLDRGALRRIVAEERPDLIEAGSPGIAAWLAASSARGRPRVPRIWFYHASVPGLVAGAGSVAERCAVRYLRSLARRFDAVIASSGWCERELVQAGVRGVRRVPLGVDLVLFDPARRARAALTRARLGLEGGPWFFYCGRFAREKRLDLVIDGWPAIERASGAGLVLAGAGPRERELRARASGRVRFLPFEHDRERLADLHAAVDVYLSPCPIESFGLAALEAQASGTPILSADTGGVAERVARSGCGRLYAAGDRDALIEAARSLLALDDVARAGLGARARADAEREHDWERVFERLLEVYREVLGR